MAADPPADLPIPNALVRLEQIDALRFRSTYNQDNYLGIIFGGQPLCQALAAAQRTVPEDWPAHSLSGYFVRGGVVADPVDYQVELLRDGRRYAFRRILATQKGEPIFDMLASFNAPDTGLEHQFGDAIEGVTDPEALPSMKEFVEAHEDKVSKFLVMAYKRDWPIELRLMDPQRTFFHKPETSHRDYWFRMPAAAGIDDPRDHHALLAFMSDYWFAGTAGSVHVTPAGSDRLSVASLNHGLWIHAPVRVDEWLLYRTESPWGGGGRGLARGMIYDRSGRLIATVVQEIAMRIVSND